MPAKPSDKIAAATTKNSASTKGHNALKNTGPIVVEFNENVSIHVGHLTKTTGQFTRRISPNSRYWKAPLFFGTATFKASIIHLPSCPVIQNPMNNDRYCSEYMYAVIPIEFSNAVKSALLKNDIHCNVDDEKFVKVTICSWVLVSPVASNVFGKTKLGSMRVIDFSRLLGMTDYPCSVNLDVKLDAKKNVT